MMVPDGLFLFSAQFGDGASLKLSLLRAGGYSRIMLAAEARFPRGYPPAPPNT